MKVGLIGCGNIGTFLLDKINQEKILRETFIQSIFDERVDAEKKLQDISKTYDCQYINNKNEFLNSDLDIIVECAHPKVALAYALDIIKHGKNILITSVGALVNEAFLDKLNTLSLENNCRIYVPSGAIGGLDALGAAKSLGEIDSVQLTTRKPPQALLLTVEGNTPVTVFSGTAEEAIKKFPQNINVAITLSIAGKGVKDTQVEILADPNVQRNIHEITIKGAFGQMKVEMENLSMPNNPKSSYLTALSALATLQRMNEPIKIGM